LGYGTGAKKLQQTLSLGGAELDEAECKRIVDLYRDTNYRIVELWRECDVALQQMSAWGKGKKPYKLDEHGVITIDSEGILLPNNLYIRYPDLRYNSDSKMIYTSRRGVVGIWGGAMVENIVQALARIIVGDQMLKISERYHIALTVHDAIVVVVPSDQREEAMKFIEDCMSTPPDWAKGLPVACEAKFGNSYGDC
jgi:DNA polymerase